MDREGSYESDLSESWSLIDINVNDESHSASESPISGKDFTIKLENTKKRKKKLLELQDKLGKYDKDCSANSLNGSDSDSNSSLTNNNYVNGSPNEGLNEDWSNCPTHLRLHETSDADDVESIEILDVDGNYRGFLSDSEVERLESVIDSNDSHDSQTCQSDDEESVEESSQSECKSLCSTARKRKGISSRNSEGTVNIVNSEEKCEKNVLKTLREGGGEGKNVLKWRKSQLCFQGLSHTVYKHYRNNLRNTVLNLSVGVIFAGVACMAIGHLLKAKDAADTGGELVETLKKLQVENAALQSRLFHINRALLNREGNPTLESPTSIKGTCEESRDVSSGDREADSSGMRTSLKSIESLSKMEYFIRSGNEASESTVDIKGFGVLIHDQLGIYNKGKQSGLKLLEDTDKKISKVLSNIEKLYSKLINLKSNLNQKLNKALPEIKESVKKDKFKSETTALSDFQSVRWNQNNKITENSPPEQRQIIQFPQVEKFYRVEWEKLKNVQEESEITNSNGTSRKSEEMKKKWRKECENDSEKRKEKKFNKVREKEEFKKNVMKKRKGTADKKVMNRSEKKKKKKMKESRAANSNFGNKVNETKSRRRKHSNLKADFVKGKLKLKKPKVKRFFPSGLQEDSLGGYRRSCLGGHRCSNYTGHWVFRWAGGREEYRRHQSMGEWQFERARGREVLRGGEENWQTKRGLGRAEMRQGERWDRGKGFFHMFSWA